MKPGWDYQTLTRNVSSTFASTNREARVSGIELGRRTVMRPQLDPYTPPELPTLAGAFLVIAFVVIALLVW